VLKQPQYSPIPVEEQVLTVYLGTNGHYDSVPTEDVRRFNHEFLDSARRKHSDLLGGIKESGKFPEETRESVVNAVNEFKKEFTTSEGKSLVEADADAMDADKVGHETVKVNKPAPKK
jgi:F-type H+-transporting ATPase subunit alpha